MNHSPIADLLKIRFPMPANTQNFDPLVVTDMQEQVVAKRKKEAELLDDSLTERDDVVLMYMRSARKAMLDAEEELRVLLAYAREFMGDRPYKLNQLAEAAGMSISGIRTAYDEDEINKVAELLGRSPSTRVSA